MDPHAPFSYDTDRQPPSALDVWVKRALRDQYRDVSTEPLPEALLQLLRDAPAH